MSLLTLTLLLSACGGPKKPEFRTLTNVKFKGARLSGSIQLSADAVFYNPNPFGLDITAMEAEVTIDGREAGQIRQEMAVAMPASSEFRLPIRFDIPVVKIYQDAGSLLGGFLSKKKVTLKIAGWVKVGAAGVEFQIPFTAEKDAEL